MIFIFIHIFFGMLYTVNCLRIHQPSAFQFLWLLCPQRPTGMATFDLSHRHVHLELETHIMYKKGFYFRFMYTNFLHIKNDTMVHFGILKDPMGPYSYSVATVLNSNLGKFFSKISENSGTFGPLERTQLIFRGQTEYPLKL